MVRVSLCSYTYNDGYFLHGLLESVQHWQCKPDEIVLVDDGSSEPFCLTEAEKAMGIPVTLIHHQTNTGFTKTKHECISAASGDIVFALDCDARVGADYLQSCLAALEDPKVGMVGPGGNEAPATDDYTSWYAYAFSFGTAIAPSTPNLKANSEAGSGSLHINATHNTQAAKNAIVSKNCVTTEGELENVKNNAQNAKYSLEKTAVKSFTPTNFVCGYAFALRTDVWRKVGGMSGFNKDLLEDSYLSNIIMQHGYKLVSVPEPVRLIRVLSRHALCRRYWKWGLGYGWVDSVIQAGQSLPQALGHFLNTMQSRCLSIAQKELTPVFYYYEMLVMCHMLLEFCNSLLPQGQLPINAGANLLALLQQYLKAYPRLWLLLKADLLKAGTLPLANTAPPQPDNKSDLANKCNWEDILVFLTEFEKGNILKYLEQEGVSLILQDEKETEVHFSGY